MRYQVTTPLTPREALEQALADFGPGGLGLQLTSQTNLSLVFQGGGGHIAVTAEPGAPTTLELETRECDVSTLFRTTNLMGFECLLIGQRSEIAISRMTALAVIEHFDVFKHRGLSLLVCVIVLQINQFGL